MNDLPPGWEWACLEDLSGPMDRAITDGPFGSNLKSEHYTSSGARVIRLQNIGDGHFRDERSYISLDRFHALRAHEVRAGDLVVASLGDAPPRASLIPVLADPAIVKADCIRIRLSSHVDPYWVLYALMSPQTKDLAARTIKGVGRPRLGMSQIRALRVPVPPLAEQHRLVTALDNYLSNLDSATRLLNRAVAGLIRFRSSLLREAVRGRALPTTCVRHAEIDSGTSSGVLREPTEGPWQVPEDWSWSTIGELFQVFIGATPKRSIAANWTGEVPWVSSGEVAFNRISATREGISVTALGNRETRLHPPGTVLLAMIGEGRTRGQVAILNVAAAHNQNCASIRVSETDVLPEYVYAVLEDRYEQTRRAASGGNQLALNGSIVRAIQIAIPPAGTQKAIVDHLDELRDVEDRLRRALEAELRRGEILRKTILADAISGQLTPQEPSDEPASVLLERIRAERATQSKSRRAWRTEKS